MYLRFFAIALVGASLVGCSHDPNPPTRDVQQPSATAMPQPATAMAPPAAATQKTLGDVISPKQATIAPPQGQYYVAIAAVDNSDTPMPDDKCVSQSFWAAIRKWIGIRTSAAVIVTAKITPKGGAPITVPIYTVSASETTPNAAGSTCDALFTNKDITFRYPSTQNPNFDIEIDYNVNENLASAAVQNTINTAKQLMTLIGGASGSPAAIIAKLGDPTITGLSASLDSAVSDTWTHMNELSYHGNLNSGADGSTRADEIDLKIQNIVAGAGGVDVAHQWTASARIYLSYYPEEFKSGGEWMAAANIMSDPIVSGLPSGQTNLDKLILNGDVTTGFDWKSLVAATNTSSLRTACEHLDAWLSSFLIDDDRLAARYAILRDSPYGDDPTLRPGSECFSGNDSINLLAMNPAYVFNDASRSPRTSDDVSNEMDPVAEAIASENPTLIKTVLIADTSKFYLSLGANQSNFYQGDAAVTKFGTLRLSCYQAGQRNLAVMGGLVTDGQTKQAALLTFDSSGGLLKNVVVMSPADAASALGIDGSKWINPATLACVGPPKQS